MNRLVILAMAFAILVMPQLAQGAALRTVALSGTTAFGLRPGEVYKTFSLPVLDNRGNTTFLAQVRGEGLTDANDKGVWTERNRALEVLARSGTPAPGAPEGLSFLAFRAPIINPAGEIAFEGEVSPLNDLRARSQGIWRANGSGTSLVALGGIHAPGMADNEVFHFFNNPFCVVNDSGQISFQATLTGGNFTGLANDHLWSERAGGVTRVVSSNTAVPRYREGATLAPVFGLISQASPTAGMSFVGYVYDTPGIDVGVFVIDDGELRTLAKRGDSAPGTPPGGRFGGLLPFVDVVANPNGVMAIHANWTTSSDPDNLGSEGDGIWLLEGGVLSPIAVSGDPVPGDASGRRFSAFRKPIINEHGQVAFSEGCNGGGCKGASIWTFTNGRLIPIAAQGDQAPGAPVGVVFDLLTFDIGLDTPFDYEYSRGATPAFNSRGQVAFAAIVADSHSGEPLGMGIWAQDLKGTLHSIVQTGDVLEVAPSDFRVVANANFETAAYQITGGHSPAFNDRGQLAFRAKFTDGTYGVFISDAVAVPEPRSWLCLVTISLHLMGRESRRGPIAHRLPTGN